MNSPRGQATCGSQPGHPKNLVYEDTGGVNHLLGITRARMASQEVLHTPRLIGWRMRALTPLAKRERNSSWDPS
jgi:hypothetical protein